MKNLKIVYLVVMLLTSYCFINAQELRMALEFPIKKYDKVDYLVEIQSRFHNSDRLSHVANIATLSVEYDMVKHIEFGGSFRYISSNNKFNSSESKNNQPERDTRLTLDFTVKSSRLNGYHIKNKTRYQVSDFNVGFDKTFLKNKTLLDYKVSKNFYPYCGLEVIYRIEKERLNSCRIHLGSNLQVFRHKFIAYFIIENDLKQFDRTPVNINYIVGTKLKF